MSKQKRYANVSQLVRDISDSQDFSKAFEQRVAKRELIKQLTFVRVSQDLSQEDIATAMGCTQSRVSKLEASEDEDLRLGDLIKYAAALGLQTQFVFFKRDMPLVERVKSHFFETKELMDRLVRMVGMDAVMAEGAAHFFNETCFNYLRMLAEKAKTLPEAVHEHVPLIKLVSDPESAKGLDHESQDQPRRSAKIA